MFERFTARARKACHYANEYAGRYGHDDVGDEHILLGLAKDSDGFVHQVLESLGVTWIDLKRKAEELLDCHWQDSFRPGKKPLNQCAKEAIELATQFAKNLGRDYVCAEHLLVGVVSYNGIAREILNDLNVDEIAVVREVEKLLGVVHKDPEEEADEQAQGTGLFEALFVRDFGPIALSASSAGWNVLETSIVNTIDNHCADREEVIIRIGRRVPS